MKKIIISLVILMMVFTGCGKKQPMTIDKTVFQPKGIATITQQIGNGFNSLTQGNITEANAIFDEVLNKEPGNSEAQFGKVTTNILLVLDDTEVQGFLNEVEQEKFAQDKNIEFPETADEFWKNTMVAVNEPQIMLSSISTFAKLSEKKPLQMSNLQKIIETVVIPVLDKVIINLDEIKKDPNFSIILDVKVLDPEVSDENRYKELDLGEVYAFSATAHFLRGMFGILTVGDLDLDYQKIESEIEYLSDNPKKSEKFVPYYNPLVDKNYPNFMGLRAEAKPKMQKVKNDAIACITNMLAGIDYISKETDSQDNDVLKFKPEDNLETAKQILNGIKECFEGKDWIVKDNGNNPFDPEAEPLYVRDKNEKIIWQVVINFGKFFDNTPPLKVFLPEYDEMGLPIVYDDRGTKVKWYNIETDGYPKGISNDLLPDRLYPRWSDPSLAGLLPTMTQETVKALFDLGYEGEETPPYDIAFLK